MRAAVLTGPGRAPDYAEHPEPEAAPGRTVVRMTAAPLVPLDLLCAGGAVGQAGIGVALARGAGPVVAVTREEAARERALRLGAVAAIGPGDDVDRLAARMEEALGGRADVVLDPVFGRPATAAAR